MIWILLLICIFIIFIDKKKIVPVYLISSMWINFDIRCGSISFIGALSIFIIILGLFTRRKNLGFKTKTDRLIIDYCLYAILIYLPFIFLSTDLSLWIQLNNIKSQFLFIILLIVVWKWNPCKTSILNAQARSINLSTILLCIYGVYTYITMTNPYMDFMSQYSTAEDLSDLLARSMEDSRGNLHGRITGTSLYTIQYGIMLVILLFMLLSINIRRNIITYITFVLILLNIYLTGSRGPLGALLIGLLFYISRILNWKKRIMYVSLSVILIFIVWSYIESYLTLFTDQNVKGSSFELREIQFAGALSMVTDNMQSLLFGRGIGYTSYYIARYGAHPLALYFESTHVSGIVNYGVLGLIFIFLGKIIFLLYIAIKARRNNLIDNESFNLLLSFLLTYFIYNILVGSVYDSFFVFSYFISLKIGIQKYNIRTSKSLVL